MLPIKSRDYSRFKTEEKTHFKEPSYVSRKPTFLNDDVYSQVLDNIVFACVDCAVVNFKKTKILLGLRAYPPQPDWWVIGGRMRPGESFNDTAKRNIKRELGLDLANERFGNIIGVYSTVWGERRQVPQGNGCHSLNTTILLKLKEDEIKNISKNNEYKEFKWFSLRDLFKDPKDESGSPKFHPALVRIAKDIFKPDRAKTIRQRCYECELVRSYDEEPDQRDW